MDEEVERSSAKIAERVQVSESSVKRVGKQWRETGRIEPKPVANGQRPTIDDKGEALLTGLVKRETALSQKELWERLAAETGWWVSQPTICRTLQQVRIT